MTRPANSSWSPLVDAPGSPVPSESGIASAPTMSGRPRSSPPESWPADDELESELPVPVGVLFGGKYTLERMFAEGGMGIICIGRHVDLQQVVAIKFLRRALSGRPSIVQRFLNEARALAALRSEHVVRVLDVGQLESGRPYLVMEHLDGMHLQDLLDREGALTVERAVRYAIQICEPLAEAHALGIVHRDIKPENLFLWSGGPNTDSVKVLDFGLAKQLGSSRALGVTGPQDSLGSPGFMSPEQVTTPQLVDSRTDVWSVGVVLYQLLTNVSPFGGGSLVEVLSHILKAQPTPLPEVLPGLDVELDAIVHRCLEKERDARYQTMAELAEALRAYLAARGQATILPAGGLKSSPPPKEPKIVIAGVHSRSPALVAMLVVLICGGFYLADRAGHVRLRNLTDGWLTARALTVGPQSPPLERFEPPLLPVLLARPTGQGHDAQTLRAVPERDVAPSPVAAPPRAREPAHEPMSAEEREERKAAYRDYLESEGLTPLSETNP